MSRDELVTASGIVMFFWDSGDEERHLLINIDPDDHQKPAAFELEGDMRDAVIGPLEEGVRIEIDFVVEHHELVDPDGETRDIDRPRIVAARVSEV